MQVNRIFWSFAECILAFNHCRPIISIDGTHMYGKYNAKLLVAIGLDANNHILPLAFALVESENNSSWKWFMSCIREGQEPKAFHRVCVRHLQGNFMTKVKDEVLKAKLGEVAYAKKKLKFKKKFVELLQLLNDKPLARKWLEDMDVERWTHAFDNGGYRWGNMTTNASKCLNKILKNGHDLLVSSLIMYTFRQTAAYFVKRSQSQYNIDIAICPPKISDRLAELRARAQFHIVMMYNPVADMPGLMTQFMSPKNIRSKRTTGHEVIFSTPYFTRICGVNITDLFMSLIQDSDVTKLEDPDQKKAYQYGPAMSSFWGI
ncbi:hypothetical protein QQ045_031154 [Rhodiola kirilowii]